MCWVWTKRWKNHLYKYKGIMHNYCVRCGVFKKDMDNVDCSREKRKRKMWIILAKFCLRMAGCSRYDIDKAIEEIL